MSEWHKKNKKEGGESEMEKISSSLHPSDLSSSSSRRQQNPIVTLENQPTSHHYHFGLYLDDQDDDDYTRIIIKYRVP